MPHLSWRTALTKGMIVSGILLGGTTNWEAVQSQPVADDTLGNERSVVVPLGASTPGDRIEGGARRGDNLFHSLQQLNVDADRSVYFNEPGVNNIITRVTGGTSSQIDGILGVLGNANLFLINPNGIIFGANAQLNIQGSFLASTASSFTLPNGGEFSATDPQAPPLLMINLPLGLQYGSNPGSIQLQRSNLTVNAGKTLALVGGSVSMDGGQLQASGGRIELGGVAGTGTVELNVDSTSNLFSLNFPDEVERANFSIINGSVVDVAAGGGGSIAVNVGNLDVSARGRFNAGIGENLGAVDAISGDITVNATGTVTLQGSSVIQNQVSSGAIGNAGNINLYAGSLYLLTGSQLFMSTSGQGNTGAANVYVRDLVSIDSAGENASTSGIINSFSGTGGGKGGDINITTGSLSVTNGAQLNTITFAQGNAGNVNINARETVSFDGANAGASGILSAVRPEAVGNGGDMNITTGSLSITNGAQLNAITRGRGDAGNVSIDARNTISIDGENPNSIVDQYAGVSAILTAVSIDDNGKQAEGNGGDINITTGSLLVTNGGELNAITRGRGDAGNIIINARDTISIDGERPKSATRAASLIFTSVDSNDYSDYPNLGPAVGNGGDINITTGSLLITRGAELNTLTEGQGNAGNVTINARDTISLDGENSNGRSSGIFSSVTDNLYTGQPPAIGDGGNVSITTGSFSATNGGGVFASTSGQGNAGSVIVDAQGRVFVQGTNQAGSPGGIIATTSTDAKGRGGDVNVAADAIRIADSAVFSAATENSFSGGSITINGNTFEAIEGGQVITATSSSGKAGNITLNATNRITLSGVNPNISPTSRQNAASGLYANTTDSSSGNGGTVQITTGNLEVFERAIIAVNGQGRGIAGDIDITAKAVQLNDSSRLSAETAAGNGGNITLDDVELLQLGNSSLISTTAGTDNASGNGGNIDINADLIVAFPNENSDIRANAFTGSGGNVRIDTQGLFGIAFRAQDNPTTNDITASSQQGVQGTVRITPPEVDPRSGLTQLPVAVVEQSDRIAQGCYGTGARQNTGEFIVKGRGGLPPSPTDSLIGDQSLASWVTLEQTSGQQISTNLPAKENATAPIVEAQSWIVKDGKVHLIATTPNSSTQVPVICQR